jgi:beta-glucanase (GH16 family)
MRTPPSLPSSFVPRIAFAALFACAACSGAGSPSGEHGGSGGGGGGQGPDGGGGTAATGGGGTAGSAGTGGGEAAGSGGTGTGGAGTGGGAGSGGQAGAGDLPGWKLTWSDEFNELDGTAPDPTKWVYDVGWGDGGWGNDELEYYTDTRENSYQEKGSLVIAARTDNIESGMQCGGAPCKYTSARIKTLGKFEQSYGRFEARIKIPTGSGMWPAFWMMGNDLPTVQWPACGEIDIMENWGADGTVIAGTPHDPGSNPEDGISGEFTFPSIGTVANDYHLYAVEWEADAIRFYVDDAEYHCVRKASADASACGSIPGTVSQAPHTWPFDHPFFMILNLAIDSSSDNAPNAQTKFPALLLVDYVRVYQRMP